MAHTKSVALYWRLQKPRYRLVGSRCLTCNTPYFPPRPLCPACRRRGKMEDVQFSGKGTVISHTVIRSAPDGFEAYVPYAVAIIRLTEGPQIAGQVVGDVDALRPGLAVRTVFRKLSEDNAGGLIQYGLKWQVDE